MVMDQTMAVTRAVVTIIAHRTIINVASLVVCKSAVLVVRVVGWDVIVSDWLNAPAQLRDDE